MLDSRQFWDKVARKYAVRPIDDMVAYEAGLVRVRAHLGAEDRVLELGCGTGSTALILAPHVGQITGSDISPEMIAIAREKPAPDNVDFQVATSETAGQGGHYDAVLAFNLLHLVPDVAQTVAHAHDQLKDGGVFISKTPCLAARKWLLGPILWVMQALGKAPPVHLLRPTQIQEQIRAAGFEIIETGDYPVKTQSRLIVARKL